MLRSLGRIAVVLVLAAVLRRLARRGIPKLVARVSSVGGDRARWEQRCRTLSGTLFGVVAIVLWGIAAITVLGEVGVNLGPLIAGAGVVGLAVGFGAQQLVRDVISGFFVLVEDQYGVGDRVTLGTVGGTVEAMSLRLTRVRGDDGVLHHIRNGDLGVVSNASRGYAVVTVAVPLPDDQDPAEVLDRVRRAMAGVVASGAVDGALLADPELLGVTELRGDAAVPVATVTARATPDGRARVQRELLRAVAAALRERPGKARAAQAPKARSARRESRVSPASGALSE